jgi:hypothetical protein
VSVQFAPFDVDGDGMALIDSWLKRSGTPVSVPQRPDLSRVDDFASQVGDLAVGLQSPSLRSNWKGDLAWTEWGAPDGLVVGESHHLDGIAPWVGQPREPGYCVPVVVTFQREPDNPYDVNAIMAVVDGRQVGYVNRHRASEVAPVMDAADLQEFQLAGVILGGFIDADREWPNRYSFGVFVWLDKRITAAPQIAPSGPTRAWPPKPDAMESPMP